MCTSVHYLKVPPHIQGIAYPQLRNSRHCSVLHCLSGSRCLNGRCWQHFTLYCPLATLYTLLSFTLYILHFTQQFTLPCPHKFQPTSFVVPSSLLSDFAPVYNLSNASLFNPPNLLQLFTYLQYQISICVHPSLKYFSTSQWASWSSF